MNACLPWRAGAAAAQHGDKSRKDGNERRDGSALVIARVYAGAPDLTSL